MLFVFQKENVYYLFFSSLEMSLQQHKEEHKTDLQTRREHTDCWWPEIKTKATVQLTQTLQGLSQDSWTLAPGLARVRPNPCCFMTDTGANTKVWGGEQG